MVVNTPRLLRRIHLGLVSQDQQVRDAAESCLSYLIHKIREDSIVLPAPLRTLYQRLPDTV